MLCYGSAIALNNKKYLRKIPNGFKPKNQIAMRWQSLRAQTVVSAATLNISTDGTVYTNYPYDEKSSVSGFWVWEI